MPSIEIPLTQCKFSLIDEEDYEKVKDYKWYIIKNKAGNQYAYTHIYNHKQIAMHRLILNLNNHDGIWDVDHKNMNGLDNRKENLRICKRWQNMSNQKILTNKSSKYKGVCWDKNRKKWMAKIRANNKYINIGRYISEEEAARKYDEYAIKLKGEFARINFAI